MSINIGNKRKSFTSLDQHLPRNDLVNIRTDIANSTLFGEHKNNNRKSLHPSVNILLRNDLVNISTDIANSSFTTRAH